MVGSAKMPPGTDVQRIAWYNLPYWAYRTAASSWRNYRRAPRPLSAQRLLRSVRPRLVQPIFLIGAPRSGTTFLGKCLGAIPDISYHFEPIATKAAARSVYEGEWDDAKARRFYRRVYAWLMRLHLDGDLVFAEKTPRNALIVPFLFAAFPNARFVHIIRDGRDAALSLSQRPWLQSQQGATGRREPGGYRYGPFARFWVEADRRTEFESTSDIHRCIWSWRRHTEAGLKAAATLPPAQYHELRYETLVSEPRPTADALLDYLGIVNQPSRAKFQEAVGGANVKSVGRWRDALCEEALQQIMAEAGTLLRRLGYVESSHTQTGDHGSAA